MNCTIKVTTTHTEYMFKTIEVSSNVIQIYVYFNIYQKYNTSNIITIKYDVNYSVMCELIEMIVTNKMKSNYSFYRLCRAYNYLSPITNKYIC